jgi:hypothetical protein
VKKEMICVDVEFKAQEVFSMVGPDGQVIWTGGGTVVLAEGDSNGRKITV